jgi:glycosyltransferase involved in cell wall biosynthesis
MKRFMKEKSTRSRILHIINHLDIGGAEQQLEHFLLYASKVQTFEMHVLVLFGGFRIDRLRKAGIKVIDLNMRRKYSLRAVWRIYHIIRSGNYDLVFAQLSPVIFYVAIASLFLQRITFITREPNVYTRRRKYRILKTLDRLMYSRYKKILCVDEEVKQELIKWQPQVNQKTLQLGKGIVLPPVRKRREKPIDLIFVGRITRQKGLDVLLEAIARLKHKGLIRRVLIVGEGNLKMHLQAEASRLSISGIASLPGKAQDINNLLQQSKCFVLPSRWEGTPSALLEAMANSVPVIATRVGGVPHVITDRVDGILIPAEDTVALSSAISELLSDKKRAVKYGVNARRKIVRDFSIQVYSQRLLQLFDELLTS